MGPHLTRVRSLRHWNDVQAPQNLNAFIIYAWLHSSMYRALDRWQKNVLPERAHVVLRWYIDQCPQQVTTAAPSGIFPVTLRIPLEATDNKAGLTEAPATHVEQAVISRPPSPAQVSRTTP